MSIEEQSLENWFNSYVDIEDMENFTNLLEGSNVVISVDRSFYLEKSSLGAAHFAITHKNHEIGSGNFIFIVALQYRNPFTVELYGVLMILKAIKFMINKLKR